MTQTMEITIAVSMGLIIFTFYSLFISELENVVFFKNLKPIKEWTVVEIILSPYLLIIFPLLVLTVYIPYHIGIFIKKCHSNHQTQKFLNYKPFKK